MNIISGQSNDTVTILSAGYCYVTLSVSFTSTTLGFVSMQVQISCDAGPPTPVIDGPNSICAGTLNQVYSCTNPTYGYDFQWSVNGGIITNGQGTPTIHVNWNTAGTQNVRLFFHWDNCTSPIGLYNVSVNPLPVPVITGDSSTCKDIVQTFFTTTGMTNYSWLLSPGGTIVSGQGTSMITTKWSIPGIQRGTVTYTDNNGCNPIVPSIKDIRVYDVPFPTITGADTICANGTSMYSTESGMSNYVWNVPGGNYTYGQDYSIIYVTFSTPGNREISVSYSNQFGCTNPSPSDKRIVVKPSSFITLTGSTSVCAGNNQYSYQTDPNMLNYHWTISGGGTITGSNSDSIVFIKWNLPGINNVHVEYLSNSGCVASKSLEINVPQYQQGGVDGLDLVAMRKSEIYETEGGMTNYIWTTDTTGTITGTGSAIECSWSQIGPHWINTKYINLDGCYTIGQKLVNVAPSICIVTYDSVTGKNKIILNDPEADWSEYKIWKETSNNSYESIGIFPITTNQVLDSLSFPSQKSEKYRMSVLKINGSQSLKSPNHKTILLQFSVNSDTSMVNLAWSFYEGFNVRNYRIYRKRINTEWQIVDSVTGSENHYNDPYLGGAVTYYIEAIPTIVCSYTLKNSEPISVISNFVAKNSLGIKPVDNQNILIYPNPVYNDLNVEMLNSFQKKLTSVTICDFLGQEVFHMSSDRQNFKINFESYPIGLYFIIIQSNSSLMTKKFLKK